MPEEQNNEGFERTEELSLQDVMDAVNEYGVLKLNSIKPKKHFIAKITAPVRVIEREGADGEVVIRHFLDVEYKKPELAGKASFSVQVGQNAIARLIDKRKGHSYTGMYAFFSRTSYKGTYPQFVNPVENFQQFDKDEAFKLKEEKKEPLKAQVITQKIGSRPTPLNSIETEKVEGLKKAVAEKGVKLSSEDWVVLLCDNGFAEVRARTIAESFL